MSLFNFYANKRGELETLQSMLAGDIGGVDRAQQYGIPPDIADRVERGKQSDELQQYLFEKYRMLEKELTQSLRFHQKFWDKNSAHYAKRFAKILGHEMPPYTVRLNVQADGISNWSGTDVSINAFTYLGPWKEGMMIQAMILETMLSQTFIDIRKKWPEEELDNLHAWGAAELSALAIYQTDFCESDWAIGYPQLEPHRGAIKKLYALRKDFQSYLENVVKYFKKSPLLPPVSKPR